MPRRYYYVLLLLLVATSLGCAGPADPPTTRTPPATATTAAAPVESGGASVEETSGTLAQLQPDVTPVAATATPTPSPTPVPPTSTAMPPTQTATAVPPTSTVMPSPTPAPALSQPAPAPHLRRLTTGGCCTQPFWSPDSRQVRFIDAPPDGPVGIWGVDVGQPESWPTLVTEELGYYTDDMAFRIEPGGETTTIVRMADGRRWTVPAGGRFVSISPDRTHVAWEWSNRDLPRERRTSQIWVASLDGSNAQQLDVLPRSDLVGWIGDDVLLLEGRESREADEEILYTYTLADATPNGMTELARAENFRGIEIAPGAEWIVYHTIFADVPEENGLWIVRTDGSDRHRLSSDFFGAYRWRPAQSDGGDRLLIIPFRPNAAFHTLWELDVTTGALTQLTDPNETQIKIANGDWTVSPDGRYVAYVDSRDDNIWVLTLNEL